MRKMIPCNNGQSINRYTMECKVVLLRKVIKIVEGINRYTMECKAIRV